QRDEQKPGDQQPHEGARIPGGKRGSRSTHGNAAIYPREVLFGRGYMSHGDDSHGRAIPLVSRHRPRVVRRGESRSRIEVERQSRKSSVAVRTAMPTPPIRTIRRRRFV